MSDEKPTGDAVDDDDGSATAPNDEPTATGGARRDTTRTVDTEPPSGAGHARPDDDRDSDPPSSRDDARPPSPGFWAFVAETYATADPRSLKWAHPRFGELDLAQWWMLQARHDADHLQQLRAAKGAAGFPRA